MKMQCIHLCIGGLSILNGRTVARKFSIEGLCISAGGFWVCAGCVDTQKINHNSTDL